MLRFKIDQNDLSVVDGGCVDECTKTLKTESVRLDYNSNVADPTKISEIALDTHLDQDLFDSASYVMNGSMICINTYCGNTLNVSFGGLRGEFKLSEQQLEKVYACTNTEKWYLYFLK